MWSAVIANACGGGHTATGGAGRTPPTDREAQSDHTQTLSVGRLYRALAEVTRSRVIVDSSKEPSHALVATAAEGVESYVLHLVRDPRAVVFSRTRRPHNKQRGPYGGTVYAVANWMKTNLAVERYCRRGRWPVLRLRYEDLTECPQDAVRDVCLFLSEAGDGLHFHGDRSAVLGIQHTVAGNRMRFACGPIEIKADDEWQRRLPRRDRILATTVALPLLARYGYAIRPPTIGERAGHSPR